MSDKDDLTVDDGKYTFRQPDEEWQVHVLRHGEPWIVISEGHNAITSLVEEHREALIEIAVKDSIITKLGRAILGDSLDMNETVELLERANKEIDSLKARIQDLDVEALRKGVES